MEQEQEVLRRELKEREEQREKREELINALTIQQEQLRAKQLVDVATLHLREGAI